MMDTSAAPSTGPVYGWRVVLRSAAGVTIGFGLGALVYLILLG